MMNHKNMEMLAKFRKAAGYQKKAIQALFPDTMNEHFDVIENELKLMIIEAICEIHKSEKKYTEDLKNVFAENKEDIKKVPMVMKQVQRCSVI